MYLYADLVRDEVLQRREEGCSEPELSLIERDVRALPTEVSQEQLRTLNEKLEALRPDPDLAEREPSDLATIRRLRPDGPRRVNIACSDEELEDRILGAWLGRAAGCTLGKPVEGWKRDDIEAHLRRVGEWPFSRYFASVPEGWDGKKWHRSQEGCLRGNITRMIRDDDMDYTLLGLHIMETYGPGFTSENVAREWLLRLPYLQVYTAEREAYRNFILGIRPPESASFRNPYREWIGAQIRADFWGYAAPGNPELAAEFAFRDASVSHTRNGIYGEIWMAGTLAAAFGTDDMEEAIGIGLSEIPAECRLAHAIRDTVVWCKRDDDWDRTRERIEEAFGGYHPVHTINNAALVVLGLLYGKGQLGPTVCAAVAGGWDTDCNGASAGSVCGAMLGARRLPYEWVGPLHDTLDSALAGLSPGKPHRFSDLARRTMKQVERVRATCK